MFSIKLLPDRPEATASDGSDVRLLLALKGGSMAHFELAEGKTSRPVAHKTVDEIWYFLEGLGVMWRKLGDQEETIRMEAGMSLTIPCGPLRAVAVTLPPWPGNNDEAVVIKGIWKR